MTHRVEVREGDCLHSIAERYGFAVETLWDHPDNDALRRRRKDPGLLAIGDEVVVPARTRGQVSCAADATHRFRRRSVPSLVRVRLFHEGEPRANEEVLTWIDGSEGRHRTDGDGVLELPVPPRARRLELSFPGDEGEAPRYELSLGALHPANTLEGLRARLANLGYAVGSGGALDPLTSQAIESFQMEHDLEVTGAPNADTECTLEDVHDAPGELPAGHPEELDD